MNSPVPLSPRLQYNAAIEAGELTADAAQARAVDALERLWCALQAEPAEVDNGWFSRWRGRAPQEPVQGLYLWGGVGRGKTHFCDLFFEALPTERKLRLHYHRFMQRVHSALRERADMRDPLPDVAAELARQARVIVLDEMHVNDITDAMLMHGLLTALFEHQVVLVTTSNVPPSGLYKDGLQRSRFLPAIALLEAHCEVLQLDSDTDYRLRTLERAPVYHTPVSDDVARDMLQQFLSLAPSATAASPGELIVNNRPITVMAKAGGVVWFDFVALCDTARSSIDYIEIAREHHSVLISGIPVMDQAASDAARRFVNLIDELYDRNVVLIVSAQAAPEALYIGKRMAFEFVRAASRLREMGTRDYLARPHLG